MAEANQVQFVPVSHIVDPFRNTTKDPQGSTKEVVAIPLAAVPPGHALHSLKPFFDAFRQQPERRTGQVTLEINSFINYVKRFKNDEQCVGFISRNLMGAFKVTVIFNYHPAGPIDTHTGFGDFRAVTYVRGLDNIKALRESLQIPFFVGVEK